MHFDSKENLYRVTPKLFRSSKIIEIEPKHQKTYKEIEKERIRKKIVDKKIAIFEALKKCSPKKKEYSTGSNSNYSELKFDQSHVSNPSRSRSTFGNREWVVFEKKIKKKYSASYNRCFVGLNMLTANIGLHKNYL